MKRFSPNVKIGQVWVIGKKSHSRVGTSEMEHGAETG